MTKTYLNTAGSFECAVEKPELGWIGEQGEKATPFVRIPLVVIEGPCKGQVTVEKSWLSAAAFDSTITRLAEVFGFDGDLVALQVGKQSFEGKRCNITTEMETYNGKPRCKVAWLNRAGGGSLAKPLDAAKVDSILGKLNAKAKALAKAANAANPQPPAPKASEPAATSTAPSPADPVEGDDVPF